MLRMTSSTTVAAFGGALAVLAAQLCWRGSRRLVATATAAGFGEPLLLGPHTVGGSKVIYRSPSGAR